MRPSTYQEASTYQHLVSAIQVGVEALDYCKTWIIFDLWAAKQAIYSKWVTKGKLEHKTINGVEKCKARMVAEGHNQQGGFDHKDTLTSVAKMVNMKTVVVIAAAPNWPLYHMDVHKCILARTSRDKGGKACKLLKLLYDLKTSS